MITLTIFGKDNTKQVMNMSNRVLLDEKNKPLTDAKFQIKMNEIASTVAGQNYKYHKIG